MRDVWVTSDPHFGHDNIIDYAGRPFSNTEEMDENLIWHWNRVVKPHDLVYCLGDFAWTMEAAKRIRPQLHGTIRLIVGNHDEVLKLAGTGMFQAMYSEKKFRDHGFLMHHRPLPAEYMDPNIFVSVHGHIHQQPSVGWNQINVCVEQTNYEPIHFDDLLERVRKVREIGKDHGYVWKRPAPGPDGNGQDHGVHD